MVLSQVAAFIPLILGGGEEEAPECSQPAKPSVPETPTPSHVFLKAAGHKPPGDLSNPELVFQGIMQIACQLPHN